MEKDKLKALLELCFVTGYGYCSIDIVKGKIEPGNLDFEKIKEEFNKAYPDIIKVSLFKETILSLL